MKRGPKARSEAPKEWKTRINFHLNNPHISNKTRLDNLLFVGLAMIVELELRTSEF